jgi:hypothetical protein
MGNCLCEKCGEPFCGCVEAELNDARRRLECVEWATEPPTVPGWHCYESPDGKSWRCWRVLSNQGSLWVRNEFSGLTPLNHFAGRWAGPIPEPKEPD